MLKLTTNNNATMLSEALNVDMERMISIAERIGPVVDAPSTTRSESLRLMAEESSCLEEFAYMAFVYGQYSATEGEKNVVARVLKSD